jgi:hypothetical protein
VRCKCKKICWTCVFFFKETINCERYVQAILGQFFSDLTEEERLYGRFQQDSATANTARVSKQALSDVFEDRVINAVFGQHVHPIHAIFFFWGCLKDRVYNSNSRTEEEIKENIRTETAIIPAEQLQVVNQNLFRR